MDSIWAAVIAAITALIVAPWATAWEKRYERKEKREQVNREYLNPLRLHLAEMYFRLIEVRERINQEEGKCQDLDRLEQPSDTSKQTPEWFNGWGCYLISICYLTARMFFHIRKLKDDLPYIHLEGRDDTELLYLISKLEQPFLADLGIFYMVQLSIGQEIFSPGESRLLTYREFSERLRTQDDRLWFDRLIDFYLQIGRGDPIRVRRMEEAADVIRDLVNYLDRVVHGGSALEVKFKARGIPLPPQT